MQRIYKQLFYVVSFLVVGGFFVVGNVSFAGSSCDASFGPPVDGHKYTCEYNDSNHPVSSSCAGYGQRCGDSPDCGGGTQCCICNAPSTSSSSTPNQTSTITCQDSTMKVVNSICVCPNNPDTPDGMKQILVDGKCKKCTDPGVCCGVKLNTSIPFIGNCIESNTGYAGVGKTAVTSTDAFPTLIGSLTKILITVILVTSFILIVVAGVLYATNKPKEARTMITNVAIGLALLGASGVILHLINPNFFG